MEKIFVIPTAKFSYNSICFYNEYTGPRRPKMDLETLSEILDSSEDSDTTASQSRKHDGTLSESGRKNLLNAIERFNYFLNLSNNRKKRAKVKTKRSLKFVTLTLASKQIHTDNEIRSQLLNQFLTELRQKFNLKNYVWKAEKQENENLHFHIIVDIFIHYQSIREIWNRIQNKLGYVDRFADGISRTGFEYYENNCRLNNANIPAQMIIDRWKKGCRENWQNPPGTEIRQVEKVRKIRAYFGKYFSKPTKIEAGFGRIWFASKTFSNFPVFRIGASEEAEEIRDFLERNFKNKMYEFEYCTVFYIDIFEVFKYLESKIITKMVHTYNAHSMLFD